MPGLRARDPRSRTAEMRRRKEGSLATSQSTTMRQSPSVRRSIDRRKLPTQLAWHRRVLRHRCKAPVFNDTAGNGRNRQPGDRSAAGVGLSSSSDASELAAVESFLPRGVREASAWKVQRIDEPVFRERVIPARTGADADGSKTEHTPIYHSISVRVRACACACVCVCVSPARLPALPCVRTHARSRVHALQKAAAAE